MIVYMATNKITGMSYIGKSVDTLKGRIARHKYDAKTHDNYFQRAIRKYGIDVFEWSILKYCRSKIESAQWEKILICMFNTKKPNGYNMTDGGDGNLGRIPTQEQRRRMSQAHIGIKMPPKPKSEIESIRKRMKKNNPMKTQSSREKMAHAHKKYWQDPKYKEKMRRAHLGQIPWNKGLTKENDPSVKRQSEWMKGENNPMFKQRGAKNHFYGKHHSEESKKKISEKAIKRWENPEYREKMIARHLGAGK